MTKATKLDKEIQEGLYDPKKPATVYIISDAKGNKKKVGYAEWLKWMQEQKKLYDPKRPSKREIGLALIREDYARNGKDTGQATRAMIEHGISKDAYRKAALDGLKWVEKGLPLDPIHIDIVQGNHYDPVPPTKWYEAMVKGIKKSSDVRNPYAIVKSIWSKLSPSKRSEIKAREKKGERFKYNLPLPVDKPTRGVGTVRMVKPFKLAEVQVNMSVKDYLTARASGLFQKMKRQDGTTALVARCKSPEKNVNLFVDKAGK